MPCHARVRMGPFLGGGWLYVTMFYIHDQTKLQLLGCRLGKIIRLS
jgi:hypothetical protein